ncbi:MAG TPA: DUF2219 family protein [Saprospiraceae bacterium]|nr:DUF2219 family protein [Saprospiraceae bacterium]
MFKRTIYFTSLSCLIVSSNSLGQSTPEGFISFGVFYDQDYTLEMIGLKKLNEDRNYTMGLGLYYSSSELSSYSKLYWVNNKISFLIKNNVRQGSTKYCAIMLANGSFTPDSLPAKYVIKNDRPYSSITYLQLQSNLVNTTTHQKFTIAVSAGLLGTNLSEKAQTSIHKSMNRGDTMDPRTPKGWDNQISDKGEPSILVSFRKEKLLTTKHVLSGTNRKFGGEFKCSWKINAGWYSSAVAELSYRLGLIDPQNWIYMSNALGASNGFAPTTKKGEVFLYGSLRSNIIAYNALMNGQFQKSPHTFSKEINPLVLDGEGGIVIIPIVSSSIILETRIKINTRTPEFKAEGRKPRWHHWMGLDLLITFI